MRSKNYKGRCIKQSLSKCDEIVSTYDYIQKAFAEQLEADEEIESFKVNVLLKGVEDDTFTTDFLCQKVDGDYCVRECVFRSRLILPRMVKLLDVSRAFWLRNGISDWAIVVDAERSSNETK